MSGLPQINAVGTLTRDPELRAIPSGAMVASFSIACNDRRRNQETGKFEDVGTTFLRCSAWRQLGENFAELTKGSRVWVTGQLRQREYEKDGQQVTTFEVDVQDGGPSVMFDAATSRRAERSDSGSRRGGQNMPSDPWAAPAAPQPAFDDSSAPF